MQSPSVYLFIERNVSITYPRELFIFTFRYLRVNSLLGFYLAFQLDNLTILTATSSRESVGLFLVSVRRLPRPSWSMHFCDVSEMNGRRRALKRKGRVDKLGLGTRRSRLEVAKTTECLTDTVAYR